MPRNYAQRNADIVRDVDILLAFPQGEEVGRGSGTWLTVRIAREKKRPHIIVMPDGHVTVVRGG